MFASNMLISCGMERFAAKIFGKAFSRVFHLPSEFCCAYIISLLCGYAQGANAVNRIYLQGTYKKEDAQKALELCSGPSPSFLIIGIGSIVGNYIIGFKIYLISVISVALWSIITRPKQVEETPSFNSEVIRSDIITESLKSSIMSTLYICGYVILFSVICSHIIKICVGLRLPHMIQTIFISIVEITNFTSLIIPTTPLYLITFASVWSGVCVHIQIKSLTGDIFNFKKFGCAKSIQSIIALLLGIFL